MNLLDLKEILQILEERDITEFEMEQGGVKLRVCRGAGRTSAWLAGAVVTQIPAGTSTAAAVAQLPSRRRRPRRRPPRQPTRRRRARSCAARSSGRSTGRPTPIPPCS